MVVFTELLQIFCALVLGLLLFPENRKTDTSRQSVRRASTYPTVLKGKLLFALQDYS